MVSRERIVLRTIHPAFSHFTSLYFLPLQPLKPAFDQAGSTFQAILGYER